MEDEPKKALQNKIVFIWPTHMPKRNDAIATQSPRKMVPRLRRQVLRDPTRTLQQSRNLCAFLVVRVLIHTGRCNYPITARHGR